MGNKPRTGLDRDTILLLTAILGLLKVIGEIVIKVVSYGRRYSELRVRISA